MLRGAAGQDRWPSCGWAGVCGLRKQGVGPPPLYPRALPGSSRSPPRPLALKPPRCMNEMPPNLWSSHRSGKHGE